MNQVVYVSRKGSTKKVAEFIARGLGVIPQAVGADTKIEHAETLFVGGALYAGKIDGKLRDFLQKLSGSQVDRVVVFSTSAGGKTILSEVKSILEPKNIKVADESFHCKGAFLFINGDRPNEEDLKHAEDFAKKVVQQS
jgi:flavodoxin